VLDPPKIQEYPNITKKKRMIETTMTDVARYWCQGYGVGCGKMIGARAHRKHAQKKRESALKGENILFGL
jgi:hypothetical protein